MKLQTIVDITPSCRKIGYEDHILLLGSCFSDEIGAQMQQRNLHVTCNPFGTLYNPLSIAQAINGQFSTVNYQFHEGLWHSMAHHGSFSRPTREETEQAVNTSIDILQTALRTASTVIITFGTSWVYEMVTSLSDEGQQAGSFIVGNCHKLPADRFTRRRLSVEEIVAAWQPIMDSYPDKHWIFTVSPIRHIKDGLHENQLSKATLLMAVEQLTSQDGRSDRVSYFPSYEILLDELRDYRFFADDLVHPSSLAVQYIWERFVETFCTPQTRNQMAIEYKHWKQTQHRPLHP